MEIHAVMILLNCVCSFTKLAGFLLASWQIPSKIFQT